MFDSLSCDTLPSDEDVCITSPASMRSSCTVTNCSQIRDCCSCRLSSPEDSTSLFRKTRKQEVSQSTSLHRPSTKSYTTPYSHNSAIVLILVCLAVYQSIPTAKADETCRLKIVFQIVRYRDCIPKRFLAPSCSGTCSSYVALDRNTLSFHRTCRCCQPLEATDTRLSIRCPDPSGNRRFVRVGVRFNRIRSCQCRPCNEVENVQAGEFSSS